MFGTIDINVFLFVTNIFIFLICGGFFIIMPRLTRKSYLFGVKIPQEQSGCPEAVALKRNYTVICVTGVLILLVICAAQFAAFRELTVLSTIYLPLLVGVINIAAVIPNWKKALRLKEERGWRVSGAAYAETSTSEARGNLTYLPWKWYALSLLIIAASFALTVFRYPALPDMVAGHINYDMRPSYMVEKTWGSLLIIPALNAATLAVMLLVAISIEKARLQISPENPRLSFAQHRVYRRRMGNALGFLTLVTVFFIAIIGLPFVFPGSTEWVGILVWACAVFIFVPIIYLIYSQVKTGQGGCKIRINGFAGGVSGGSAGNGKSGGNTGSVGSAEGGGSAVNGKNGGNTGSVGSAEGGGSAGNAGNGGTRAPSGAPGRKRDDDRFWFWGMFYYNKEDPACVVENRFGTKIGFNYAQLPVQIGSVALILGLVALYAWMTLLFIREGVGFFNL